MEGLESQVPSSLKIESSGDMQAESMVNLDPTDIEAETGAEAEPVTRLLDSIVEKWRDISLEEKKPLFDAQALELTERKEAYLSRRKTLSTKIREFSQQFISGDAPFDIVTYRNACKNMVDLFKVEFDNLAKSCKLTEDSFLSLYQLVRDAPDPFPIFKELMMSLSLCQDEVQAVRMELHKSLLTRNTSSDLRKAVDDRSAADIRREVRESMEAEQIEERSRLEEDFRKRELSLRSYYERRDEDMQVSHQAMMTAKDAELASVASELQHASLKMAEYAERELVLSEQLKKQQMIEDKLFALSTELSKKQSALDESDRQVESLQRRLAAAEGFSSSESKKRIEAAEAHVRSVAALQTKIAHLEGELSGRPPADLTAIAGLLGMPTEWTSDGCNGDKASAGADRPEALISWSAVEDHIVSSMREAASAAAAARTEVQGLKQSLKDSNARIADLSDRLAKREATIDSLERDLKTAQSSLDSVRRSMKSRGLEHSSQAEKSHFLEDLTSDADYLEAGSGDLGASIIQTVQGQRDRLGQLAQEHEKEAIALRQCLLRNREENKELQAENMELFKRLRVLRASNANIAGASGRGGQITPVPNMGVDSRGNAIKPRYSRKKVGAWNYSNESSSAETSATAVGPVSVLGSATTSDKDYDDVSDGDALESRYVKLYEAQLDPFRIEEIDRQIVMSRLNFIDWGLAVISRAMLRDQWTRFILVLYLLLVHIFAGGYVIQVLNPEIESEISGQHVDPEKMLSTIM
jgi:hypothetical protein